MHYKFVVERELHSPDGSRVLTPNLPISRVPTLALTEASGLPPVNVVPTPGHQPNG